MSSVVAVQVDCDEYSCGVAAKHQAKTVTFPRTEEGMREEQAEFDKWERGIKADKETLANYIKDLEGQAQKKCAESKADCQCSREVQCGVGSHPVGGNDKEATSEYGIFCSNTGFTWPTDADVDAVRCFNV